MAENSSIEWTTHTLNPWRGCTMISPGCTNCYAERLANRNPATLGVWGPKGTRVLAAEAQWRLPEKWNRESSPGSPALVFCASLADVFEDWEGQMTDSHENPLWFDTGYATPDPKAKRPYTLKDARERLWDLIRKTPNLRWQLLTKRPENIARMMPHGYWPNVWLGTSVENQEYAWRLDALAEAPIECPVRFCSAEPLLGPLSIWDQLQALQWVIIGGESGGDAREMRLGWVRSLLAQCRDARCAAFVKQMGRTAIEVEMVRPVGSLPNLPLPHSPCRPYPLPLTYDAGHGGDMRDWPGDVQVRQFPFLNLE